VIAYNDRFYRARLQALQAVDEIVEGVITRLNDAGILDNTYVIYSTDNGFHISQHRLPPGKTCGYEEDINIPLIIRGPGVPKGETTDIVTAHTDLAPTFLALAGAPPRPDFDGTAIPVTQEELRGAKGSRQEHINVEFWGRAVPEGIYGFSVDEGKMRKSPKSLPLDSVVFNPAPNAKQRIVTFAKNNTYKAIRIVSPSQGYNLYYSVWCTNEHELYNLTSDPFQLHNIYPPPSVTFPNPHPLRRLVQRLDALLLILKSCKGQSCIEPWRAFHADGQVRSLQGAMHSSYDGFYARIAAEAKVGFKECAAGYVKAVEGPEYGLLGVEEVIGRYMDEVREEEELRFLRKDE
jgi:N-acetylglucosamine-6-sulfatase